MRLSSWTKVAWSYEILLNLRFRSLPTFACLLWGLLLDSDFRAPYVNLGDDLYKDTFDVFSISPWKGDPTFRSRRQSIAHLDILRNLGVAYLRQASHFRGSSQSTGPAEGCISSLSSSWVLMEFVTLIVWKFINSWWMSIFAKWLWQNRMISNKITIPWL